MFIRVKSTPNSPRKSVQICEGIRKDGKVCQRVLRHVGVAGDEKHLAELKKLAEVIKVQIIDDRKGPFLILPEEIFKENKEDTAPLVPSKKETFPEKKIFHESLNIDLNNLREEKRIVEGFHDIFGKLFNQFGFHTLLGDKQGDVLKDVLFARIANPASKHRTQSILSTDFGRDIALERIYRMMDALLERKDDVQKRVLSITESLCFREATVLLFDVTTLYFESFDADELRNFGYSKDQKFQMTQVVLALATTKEGLPIGYRLFPGNTAEITTLLTCLEEWKKILPIEKIIFVGDRGMMSEKNLEALEKSGVTYVVGAKLKKMSKLLKENILHGPRQTEEVKEPAIQDLKLGNGRRLVVNHSLSRAIKDKKDRERGIAKVHKRIGKGEEHQEAYPQLWLPEVFKDRRRGKTPR